MDIDIDIDIDVDVDIDIDIEIDVVPYTPGSESQKRIHGLARRG